MQLLVILDLNNYSFSLYILKLFAIDVNDFMTELPKIDLKFYHNNL